MIKRTIFPRISYIFLSFFLNCLSIDAAALTEYQIAKINAGAAVVRIAGCADCHSESSAQYMAGGVKLVTDFGNFYTPNITPDRATGIGNWTYDQFYQAIRFGRRHDGSYYYPVFPYRSYTNMSSRDIRDVFEYLQNVPAIRKPNRPHELRAPFNQRELLWGWQKLYFEPGPMGANFDRSAAFNRGAYLVEALAHCTECHTPRGFLGGLEKSQWMAGSAFNLAGKVVPNVTPDIETGVGSWSKTDWQRFLSSGITPNLKTVGNEMAQVIQNTSGLSQSDRDAIIEYMQALPPVHHWADGVKK